MLKNTHSTNRDLTAIAARIGFHAVVIVLSAAIVLALPTIVRESLAYWPLVENDQIVLISVEAIVAILLVTLFTHLHVSVRDRRFAKAAIGAGLVSFSPNRSRHARQLTDRLKEKNGMGRSIMVIGSTGHETFVDPESDFHTELQQCLWANILLLNPYSEESTLRVQAMAHPDMTLERVREEAQRAIELLKRLHTSGKDVKLKFYSGPPLVKLVILGDYLWLQHYHSSLDVRVMPEYVFQHNLMDHGLYTLFYQYFAKKWQNPQIPEYDFTSDELVYRDRNGSEVKRIPFGQETACEGRPWIEEDLERPHGGTSNRWAERAGCGPNPMGFRLDTMAQRN